MSNEYSGYLICTNCSHQGNFNVPKGMTVTEFAKQSSCPKCGCKTLRSFSDMLNPNKN